ncbi:MAG: PcfJ-like protein [Pseudomonadota bacterium]|jgi:hypothetical protein
MNSTLRLGPNGSLELACRSSPGRLEVSLHGTSPRAFTLDTRTAGDGFDGDVPCWSVVRGVPCNGPGADVVRGFVAHLSFALSRAWGLQRSRERADHRPSRADWKAAVEHLSRHLHAYAGQLSPSLHDAVRCFAPGIRWPLYVALSADPSGRLRQLAAATPGALVFALAHARGSDGAGRQAARTFREAVLQGTALKRALAPLLEDWAGFGARRGQATLRDSDLPEAFYALSHAPPAERERRLREQALLLRRAHPCVGATLLWLPPPLAFAPEDLPSRALAQRRWFKALKTHIGGTAWLPDLPREVQASAVRWVSRHSARLYRPGSPEPVVTLDELLLLAGREGPVPRDASIERVSFRAQRAHVLREFEAEFGPEVAQAFILQWEQHRHDRASVPHGEVEDDTPLPAPLGRHEEPGFTVEPLATAGALWSEGVRLEHCVGAYAGSALAGTHLLFHVELEGQPLTLEVLRGVGGRWRLGQLRGLRNRPPTEAELRRVHGWWLGARARLPRSPPTDAPRALRADVPRLHAG